MFKLSTTNTHDADGPVVTVWATCRTKSASVRVGPRLGASSWPVTTWKLPISVAVPCRLYSNSRHSTRPGLSGSVAATRSSACRPVISSVQTVCVFSSRYKRGAS